MRAVACNGTGRGSGKARSKAEDAETIANSTPVPPCGSQARN